MSYCSLRIVIVDRGVQRSPFAAHCESLTIGREYDRGHAPIPFGRDLA